MFFAFYLYMNCNHDFNDILDPSKKDPDRTVLNVACPLCLQILLKYNKGEIAIRGSLVTKLRQGLFVIANYEFVE